MINWRYFFIATHSTSYNLFIHSIHSILFYIVAKFIFSPFKRRWAYSKVIQNGFIKTCNKDKCIVKCDTNRGLALIFKSGRHVHKNPFVIPLTHPFLGTELPQKLTLVQKNSPKLPLKYSWVQRNSKHSRSWGLQG